jgi:SOS-response transcriptional repressor LexA
VNAPVLSATDFAPIAPAFSGETSVHGRVLTLRKPTERQMRVLRFVHEYAVTRGSPPTIREIAAAVGVSSTNGIAEHLSALQRKGLVVRRDSVSRGVRVTVEGLAALGEDPSAFRDAPAANLAGRVRDEGLELELRAARAENARLRLLLARVQRASITDIAIVLQAIRSELGE